MANVFECYEFRPTDGEGNDTSCPDCAGKGGQQLRALLQGGVVDGSVWVDPQQQAREAGTTVCARCNGTGYLTTTSGGTWAAVEDYRAAQWMEYAIRLSRKEQRRQQIARARLLSVFQAYVDKPIPSIWDWIREPAV